MGGTSDRVWDVPGIDRVGKTSDTLAGRFTTNLLVVSGRARGLCVPRRAGKLQPLEYRPYMGGIGTGARTSVPLNINSVIICAICG
jgi:hypothetical protein